jgi:WD40 repeat protein/serine/threonine protein kinase
MDTARWQYIQAVFEAALRQDTGQRAAFVDGACGADAALRAEVLTLLAHEAQARREHFLLPPAPGNSATPHPDDGRTVVVPPSRLADYEILGELGRGGTSVVYRARQVKLNRLVALKMLLNGQHAGTDELGRFRGEARALARLQHPNIVQIHDVGEHDGRPYFALELVDGGSLKERLTGTPLPPRQAAQLVQTLAEAIHAAHQCGIVHRDLKPGNVLLQKSLTPRRQDATKVEEREDEGNGPTSSSSLCASASLREALPKITDFGLAKRLDESGTKTQSGAFLGTPSYTAPEQAAGEVRRIGPATDVYGLGAILYELLTGRPPFRAETAMETLRQVMGEDPAPPRNLSPRLPRDLETICLKCLRKEPQQRYATAADLAEDLRRFLAGEVIRARPTAVPERAAKWVRRRPAAAVALLAAVVAGLALPAVLLWHNLGLRQAYVRVERSERQARANEARAQQLVYASDVRLADQLFKTGDVARMTELLERHVPAAGEEDRRHFAWRYLWPHRQALPAPLRAHEGALVLLALAPDGRVRVTAGRDGLLKLWDPDTGRARVASATVEGRKVGFRAVALAPDGGTVAALSEPGTVLVWDGATGEPKACPGPVASASAVAFSADGRFLALGGDGAVRLWDVARAKECGRVRTGEGGVRQVEFSPDGRTLATLSDRSRADVKLWDPADGTAKGVRKRQQEITQVSYSPRGTFLATVGGDGGVVLDDLSSGDTLDWPELAAAKASRLAFSPDEQTLATGSADGGVSFWDVSARTLRARLRWQSVRVGRLAFAADGRRLAVATDSGLVYRVAPPGPQDPDRLLPGLGEGEALAFVRDGSTLVVGDHTGAVHLVDTDSGEVRRCFRAHTNAVRLLAAYEDGRLLATARRAGGTVAIWEAATGGAIARLPGEEAEPSCLAFAPNRPLLAVGSKDGRVVLWDVSATPRRRLLGEHRGEVRDAAFAPDGRSLVTGGADGTIRLWDTVADAAGQPPWASLSPGGEVTAVTFSPDGQVLAAAGSDGRVWAWRLRGKDEPRPVQPALPHGMARPVPRLLFLPDGRTLVAVERGLGLRFVDVATGVRVDDLPGDFRAVALSPDGHRLAVADASGCVSWYVPEGWQISLPPGQPLRPVHSLTFAADGRTLITGSLVPEKVIQSRRLIRYDTQALQSLAGAVRLWDVATGREQPGLPGRATMAPPELVAAAAHGNTLAAGGQDGSVWLWDLASQRPQGRRFVSPAVEKYVTPVEALRTVAPYRPVYGDGVQALAVSADGRLLATVGSRGGVTVWDVDGWRPLRTLPEESVPPEWAAFTPDGGKLVLTRGGQVQFWDPRTGELVATLGAKSDPPITCGAVMPSGTTLAVGDEDHRIRLWDIAAGEEKGILIGHQDRISALAFSPDGRTLASGSWDRTVKLWSLAALQELASLEKHTGKVFCLAFSPDGTVLASGGEEARPERGEVFLWRAPLP